MAKTARTPVINEHDEVRDLTADERLWVVRNSDFESFEAAMAFIDSRKDFLDVAESMGLARGIFAAFQPSKPGFVERAVAAMESVLKKIRHAAE